MAEAPDKWKALQELGSVRQQLKEQQALLSECEKQHADDLQTNIVVMDVPQVSGPHRVVRLWQITSTGQTVKQTATVQDGVASFAAIPQATRQSLGITVEETDHPAVNGPDFRSGPLPPPSAEARLDPVTRVEIVILDAILVSADSLSQAVPALPIQFSYPGGQFGTINLSVTSLTFSLANGGMSTWLR
jgi:hypothetical protein